ncbi:MAG: hypothetical protein J6A89_03400 [Clostridia bacterium]|nr:hypothetical protein [Clostridia bacterium]
MEYIQGKYFSVKDSKNVKTVIYEINKTPESKLKELPKITIQRLEYIEKVKNNQKRRIFFVDKIKKSGNKLLFLSFEGNKVTLNMAILKDSEIKYIKKPILITLNTINNNSEELYKEINYTPNAKRPIIIIDPETGNEIRAITSQENKSNNGMCKIKLNKLYFAFEIKV